MLLATSFGVVRGEGLRQLLARLVIALSLGGAALVPVESLPSGAAALVFYTLARVAATPTSATPTGWRSTTPGRWPSTGATIRSSPIAVL